MRVKGTNRRGLLAILAALVAFTGLTATPAGAALPEEFASDAFPGRPTLYSSESATGPRRTLVVVLRFDDPPPGVDYALLNTGIAQQAIFAGPLSVARYFSTASGGLFTLTPAADSQGANDGVVVIDDVSRTDWIDPALDNFERRHLLLEYADPVVNYALFDDNGDGNLDVRELTVVGLVGDGGGYGQAGGASGGGVALDGKTTHGVGAFVSGAPPIGSATIAHELSHEYFRHTDWYGYGIGSFDIMGPTVGLPTGRFFLPSAVTRMQLGWRMPTVVDQDGWFTLRRADRPGGTGLLLHDPARGIRDYLLVENRTNADASSFDNTTSDSGLVAYRVDMSQWAGRVESDPPIEILAPDGLRRAPACVSHGELEGDHAIGVTTLQTVDERKFGSPPYDLLLDDPDVVDDEEIVRVTAADPATERLTLAAPTALAHADDKRATWELSNWQTRIASTWTSAGIATGATTLPVGRVVGTIPAVPFGARLGGPNPSDGEDVAVIATTASTWTIENGTSRAYGTNTRVIFDGGGFCRGGSAQDAWDPSDPTTPADTLEPTWQDGTPSRVTLREIGPRGETVQVYADVPGPGLLIYPPATPVVPVDRERLHHTLTFTVRNTGEVPANYRLELRDGRGRLFSTVTQSLAVQTDTAVAFDVNTLVTGGPPPFGLALTMHATALTGPAYTTQRVFPVDWPVGFGESERSYSGSVTMPVFEVINPLDRRVFAEGIPGAIGSSRQTWSSVAQLSIDPLTDTDFVGVTLPNVSAAFPEIRPVPTGDPVPLPECGTVEGYEPAGPIGAERIQVSTEVRVRLLPRDGFTPPVDQVRLTTALADEDPSRLGVRVTCPVSEIGSIVGLLTEPQPGQTRLQRYRYELEVDYVVTVTRVPKDADFWIGLNEARTIRQLGCLGGMIPFCHVTGLQGLGSFTGPFTPGPSVPDPGCIADGCPGWSMLPWANKGDFDLALNLPLGSKVELRDAFGTLIAQGNNGLPPNPQSVNALLAAETFGPEDFNEVVGRTPPPPPTPITLDPVFVATKDVAITVPQLPAGNYLLGVTIPKPPPGEITPEFTMRWHTADTDGDGVANVVDGTNAHLDQVHIALVDNKTGATRWQVDGDLTVGNIEVNTDAHGITTIVGTGTVTTADQRVIAVAFDLERAKKQRKWSGKLTATEKLVQIKASGKVLPLIDVGPGRARGTMTQVNTKNLKNVADTLYFTVNDVT